MPLHWLTDGISMKQKIIIMGAAGRDFHVFNCCYRDNPEVEVVAFTATQIPHIDDRRYPTVLAGAMYPDGIPIYLEEELDELLGSNAIDEVVFAYSDVNLDYVESRRKKVSSHGVRFSTFDIDATMLPSTKPVIAITGMVGIFSLRAVTTPTPLINGITISVITRS